MYTFKTYPDNTVGVFFNNTFQCVMENMEIAKNIFKNN